MTPENKNISWKARLAFNIELWLTARAIPFLASKKSLSKNLELAEATVNSGYLCLNHAYIEKKIRRVVRGPILMRDRRCLRIGILGYRFLCKAGYSPELHFGVSPDSILQSRIDAHCWVCIDGKPVIGEPEPNMLTVHIHNAHLGRITSHI